MPNNKLLVSSLIILALMGLVMVMSVKDDTVTTDENLMIGVGHLILKEQYFKIGFEHPPLMRDLVALPLLFMDLKPATEFINEEARRNISGYAFNFGENFIYDQTTPPEDILLAARIPAIGLTLLLGFLAFMFSLRHFGMLAATMVLGFYVTSPFFLTHGRFTTMDVPTALFSFAAIWSLLRLLQAISNQNKSLRRAVEFGLVLAGALLTKFPMASLVPFLTLVYFAHALVFKTGFKNYLRPFLIVFLVSLSTVYVFYFYHIWNYPQSEHIADIQQNLAATRGAIIDRTQWIIEMAKIEWLRPLAHYFYGLNWQMLREGAFGYFMGEGSYRAWPAFYPYGFLAKNPESFFILVVMALGVSLLQIRRVVAAIDFQWRKFAIEKFAVLVLLAWVLYYGYVLIFLNSGNTGSRYLMPILVPVIILTFAVLTREIARLSPKAQSRAKIALGLMLALQTYSVLRVHPHYLSYFSALVGGHENGSKNLVDTDVEWGQDISRLGEWAAARGIKELNVAIGFDYTGDGRPPARSTFTTKIYEHYLGSRFKAHFPGAPVQGWLAVPGRILRWGQAVEAENRGWGSQTYSFLKNIEPVANIGGSIWVYHLDAAAP